MQRCILCRHRAENCLCHTLDDDDIADMMRFFADRMLQQIMQDTLHEQRPCDFTHAPVLKSLVRSTQCLFRLRQKHCCLCLGGRRGPQNTRWWSCKEGPCQCTAHAACVAKWLCTHIDRSNVLALDGLQCFACRRRIRFLDVSVDRVQL